jgi:heme A synthase
VFFAIVFMNPERTLSVWGELVGRLTGLLVYLPTVVMILRRPNEGEVPKSIARLLAFVTRRGRT